MARASTIFCRCCTRICSPASLPPKGGTQRFFLVRRGQLPRSGHFFRAQSRKKRRVLARNMRARRIHLSFNGKPKATASAHKACVTPTSRRRLRLAVKRVWLRPSAALGLCVTWTPEAQAKKVRRDSPARASGSHCVVNSPGQNSLTIASGTFSTSRGKDRMLAARETDCGGDLQDRSALATLK